MFHITKKESCTSTNDLAKDSSINSIIISKIQTQGRGRFKRDWDSQLGGLWFSICLEPKREPFEYTFIASLAVYEAIKNTQDIEIKTGIKWPNDIYYQKKKLCGILPELDSQGEKNKLVLGIGINANNTIQDKIKNKATSLKEILNKSIDSDKLFHAILKYFEKFLNLDKIELIKHYKENCIILNKEIELKEIKSNHIIKGTAIDITQEGNLVIKTKEKKELIFNEGEITTYF